MKKLKLSTSTFNRGEVLTRAQLKKVFGGDTGSGSGTGSGQDICGPNGPMFHTFCIPGPQDTSYPCTPGWPMGGLVCPNGGICCSLLS